jgi:IclR family KDG regulon transcriptional repressor
MTFDTTAGAEQESSEDNEGLQSLTRAIQILELLAAAPTGAGLSVLAQSSGMSKASVLRILRTLQANDYVTKTDDAIYRIGWKLFILAQGRSEAQDLRETVRPFFEKLSDVSSETSHLALLSRDEVVYIDKIEGRQRVRVTTEIGRRVPLYAVASGKAILAYQDEAFVKKIMKNARAFTDNTIVSLPKILEDIEGTRRRGYSIAKGEMTNDVGSIGAPLIRADGKVEAAVSIVFPLAGNSDERIATLGGLVSETAKEISAELGWFGKVKEKK